MPDSPFISELLASDPIILDKNFLLATVDEIISISRSLCSSNVSRSFYAMLLLSLPASLEEINHTVYEGFFKEFNASQNSFKDHRFDYSSLRFFGTGLHDTRHHPEWDTICRDIIPIFVARVHRSVLFPDVNRVKNVGRKTAYEYLRHRPTKSAVEVTTLDLEILYAEEGIKIEGPCEVRSAFRYNDLKPRVYYCQGGTSYHASKYMRSIAVHFMESIPATKRKARDDPYSKLSLTTEPQDWVVNWDLTTFTTRLKELKHFMWYFIELCRGYSLSRKPIHLFDTQEGVIAYSLLDLLHDYNESMNMFPEFDISRMFDYVSEMADDNDLFRCKNGGLLGVPGNIGMSTGLHGLIANQIVGDHAVCVGDDAIAVTQGYPTKIIRGIEQLGLIERSKFQITPPVEQYGQELELKFLKRRVTRTIFGLKTDFLLGLPVLSESILCPQSGRIALPTRQQVIEKVIMSLGRILWNVQEHCDDVTDNDLIQIESYFRYLFTFHQIPTTGRIPPVRIPHEADSFLITMAIPSLNFREYDPRILDWAEFVYDSSLQTNFTMPSFAAQDMPYEEELYSGTFLTRKHPCWKLLEDLGYLEVKPMFETFRCIPENKRRFMKWIKNDKPGPRTVEIRILKPVVLNMDMIVRNRIHTMFGNSRLME
jgi:hypothetical protein